MKKIIVLISLISTSLWASSASNKKQEVYQLNSLYESNIQTSVKLFGDDDNLFDLVLFKGVEQKLLAKNVSYSLADSSVFMRLKNYKNEVFIAIWLTGNHYQELQIFDTVSGKSLFRMSTYGEFKLGLQSGSLLIEGLEENLTEKNMERTYTKTESLFPIPKREPDSKKKTKTKAK